MKKLVAFFILLTMLIVMILPVTALASDNNPDKGSHSNITLPDSSTNMKKNKPDKSYIESMLKESGDSEDTGSAGPSVSASAVAQSLPTLSPTPVKKTLSWDDWDELYEGDYYFTPSITGIYSFIDTGNNNSDLYIFLDTGNATAKTIAYDDSNDPFALSAYLERGIRYDLSFSNNVSSLNYLVCSPASLDATAYTLSSGGQSYSWCQSFIITVPQDDIYTFNITCPSKCSYDLEIYDSELNEYAYVNNCSSSQCFLTSIKAGTYYIYMNLNNSDKKTDTYSISVDAENYRKMNDGVPVTCTLNLYDTLTTNSFTPLTTGYYRFACSRSDASLAIYDYDKDSVTTYGTNIINSSIYLTSDDLYFILLSTNGNAGSMTYSITMLSPDSTLSGISTSAGSLYPAFSSSTGSYTLSLDSDSVNSITLTPQAAAPGGSILMDGTVRGSETIPVTSSTDQIVAINVTSPNGANHNTYNVHVRAKSKACDLTAVGAPFSLVGHIVYGTVSNSTGSQAVNVTTNSQYATWALTQSSGDITSKTLALSEGLNRAFINVTSEDGKHTASYPLFLYRLSSSVNPVIIAYDSNYNEISDGSVINKTAGILIFGQTTLQCSIKKDGQVYGWNGGDLLTQDGLYTINLTDGNGHNADTLDFAIDNSAPAITATSGGDPITTGSLCTKDVTVTVSDDHPGTNTAKKDGADYAWPSGGTFTEDGSYAITAKDVMGNTSTFSFTLDKTPPVITAKDSSGNTIYSGSFGFKPVTVSVSGNSDKPTATKNGASFKWPSKDKFTASGTYVVSARDTAGNVTTFTFTLDSSKPIITAKAGTKTIKNNGSANKSVTVTVSDANIDPVYPTVTEDGASKAWPDHGVFTEEGKYFVTAKDRSGNITTITFTIDLPPVLSVTSNGAALNNNGITVYDVNITKSDKFMKTYSLKKDGKTFAWPADGSLTADGIYSITLQDKIGNKTSVKFTIDKKAPVISAGTTLFDGVYTNKSYVTVKISDLTKLTVKTVTKNGAAIPYPSSGKFSAEGSYVITATDSAGHTSAFTFTIDKTAPVINASAGGSTVVKGSTVTQDVDLSITESNISAITITKDGADLYQYPRDAAIWNGTGTYKLSLNGLYVITLTDKAGNKATTTFRINKP